MANIITDGALMILWTFIVVILYILLSSPFDEIVSGFEDSSYSDAEIDATWSMQRIIFNMVFAILGAVGVFWFIIRVFKREPNWGYKL